MKVPSSEEPGTQPEDGGFNDLNKGHLQVGDLLLPLLQSNAVGIR